MERKSKESLKKKIKELSGQIQSNVEPISELISVMVELAVKERYEELKKKDIDLIVEGLFQKIDDITSRKIKAHFKFLSEKLLNKLKED